MVMDMLRYGWRLVLYSTITLAFNSVDKLVVEQFFNLEALGIYGFAYLIARVVEILINALNNVVNPQVYRLLKKDDSGSLNSIRSLLNSSSIAVFALMAAMIACAAPLIHWFINPRYHEVVFYLPLLIVSYIPRLYFIYYSIPLFYYHKTKVLPLQSSFSLLLGVAYNLLLLPFLGIYGVCIALFLTRLTQCLMAYYICQRLKLFPPGAFNLRFSWPAALLLLTLVGIVTVLQRSLTSFWQVWLYIPLLLLALLLLAFRFRQQLQAFIPYLKPANK
jgi:O-antigen/teichoic acid export membrane protein